MAYFILCTTNARGEDFTARCRCCRKALDSRAEMVFKDIDSKTGVRYVCSVCRLLVTRCDRNEAKRWGPVARALAAHDRAWGRFFTQAPTARNDEAQSLLDAACAADVPVQEAFYQATKDVNTRDKAALVTPDGQNGWLRKVLAAYGLYHGTTRTARANRGWGW